MSPEEIEAGYKAAHAREGERVIESGWALFCVDGPNAGKIATDGFGPVTSDDREDVEARVKDEKLIRNGRRVFACTAFRVGRYRIVEVTE